ncbi:hypothetical protein SKAU_G00189880 [Synaphobranchus kaupii]|uniref:Uncharacterized protein n=1 Tax=Synaphobranchus kaupii TaxID=118154 RepID=A0A9Q1FDH5_SYNKA|nr:hypothetical protein SKAU_G00189880 [Synaphobranchus kaupii]
MPYITVDYEQQFLVQRIDMETILSTKFQLNQQQVLEPVLITNLDYAARIIACMPTAILSRLTLSISGERVLVEFILGESGDEYGALRYPSDIHFTVISNDGQPQLIRRVVCGHVITDSDIQDVHFSGHNCQDMVKSCSRQARELVSQGNKRGIRVLHIFCNSLSLTYSIDGNTEDGQSVVSQSPQTKQKSVINSYILKTQCRLKFSQVSKIGQVLKMKCWLEQEKPQKRGLIACMNHLLKQFTELPNAPSYTCKFILQSDGEMVELQLVGPQYSSEEEYFFFGGPEGVSMFPAKWLV